MLVHLDDSTTLGDDDALGEVEHVKSSQYTIKVRAILGAGRDDAKGGASRESICARELPW